MGGALGGAAGVLTAAIVEESGVHGWGAVDGGWEGVGVGWSIGGSIGGLAGEEAVSVGEAGAGAGGAVAEHCGGC